MLNTQTQDDHAHTETAQGVQLDDVLAETKQELDITQRAEQSLLDQLQKVENAAAVFKRRAELIETCYLAAIRRTRPQDWVLFRDAQGSETGMLCASGANLVAEVYGIAVQNLRPQDENGNFKPDRIESGGGAYALRGTCDAWSRVNGLAVHGLEGARRSDEDFTGRGVTGEGGLTTKKSDKTGALDSDLRSSVLTLLRTKAVRVLCGMTRVPTADLERAWKGAGKQTAACRKGHGFGSGSERGAQSVTPEAVAGDAKKLGQEILRRVGGDKADAAKLLKEITSKKASGKGKAFAGFDTIARLTADWQIQNAYRKLAQHPVFGDARQQDEEPPPPEDERAPGEDDG